MQQIKDIKNQKITTNPIVYFWYFRDDIANKLLIPLKECIDFSKITYKIINNTKYYLLYIGKAKNGHQRLIEYHILDKQNYHQKGIKNKRLSSLRQTISALLGINMSTSKEKVDEIFDTCIVDWIESDIENVEQLETSQIKNHYLPLNDLHSITPKECRQILRKLKKEYKK